MWTETRPTTNGFNDPSGDRREATAVSVLRLAAFFKGASAPRDRVACETAGLVWFVATSRYERRRFRMDETLPGGAAVAEVRVRRDGRHDGGGSGDRGGLKPCREGDLFF